MRALVCNAAQSQYTKEKQDTQVLVILSKERKKTHPVIEVIRLEDGGLVSSRVGRVQVLQTQGEAVELRQKEQHEGGGNLLGRAC